MSPSKPPPPPPSSSSQMLARLLGTDDDAQGGPRAAAARAARRIGWIALAVATLTLILLAFVVWPLIRLRTHPPAAITAAKPDEPFLTAFADDIDDDLAQIEGRSLFAVPGPPSPKKEATKKASPKPTRYGGPAVVAMVNNQVWFANGDHPGLGETKGGVKVVSIDPPWSARLEWEGAEFDVDVFSRSTLLAGSGSRPATSDAITSDPPPVMTPKQAPAPANSPAAPQVTPAPTEPPPPIPGDPTGTPDDPAAEPPPSTPTPPPAPAPTSDPENRQP